MIKSLKKNDIRTTPFTAAKKWNPQNKLHKDLILWQSGSVSGSLSLTFKEYNDGTVAPYTYISSAIALQQQQDDFLRFREGVNLSGSISPTGSFYYDPVLSEKNLDGTYKTVLYATTKHLFYKESQDPTKIFGLESLDSSNVNRSLPDKISTFNIPQNKFGENVIPKSVVITHEIQGQTYNVVDDGNSNLVVSDKTFINNQDANIDKVPSNIILNNVDKNNTISTVYDGSPKTVTATTNPSNLSYYITYNGSTTPPTDAGTYTIVATIDDNFYTGTINGTFIIQKAAATITISNVSQIYDGNPKSVTVVTVPSTLNRTVTYNGSTTPPTNVGKYNVVVTINDINYQGTQTVELNIAGNSSTISAPDFSKTYGDADFTIPLNTNSNGSVLYTITSGLGTVGTVNNGKIKIIGVGTIVVTITQSASGNYAAATTNCSITISQKPLTVTGITAADKVQNASSLATVNTTNAVLQGIIPKPNGNGTLDDVKLIGTAVGTFSDANVGEGKTVTIISGLALSGLDAPNYNLVPPTATAAIKVSGANGTITMPNATVTYNGNPQPLGVSVNDDKIPIKITYRENDTILRVDRLYRNQLTKLSGNDYPKDIRPSYKVTAELDTTVSTEILYTVTTVTATLNITSITGIVTFGPNIFYYDGNPKPVQILSTFPSEKEMIITYNGLPTVPTTVGIYNVLVKFKDNNVVYNNINNPFKLKIKEIPTIAAATSPVISKETDSPQDQKNIITFTTNTGTVYFRYNVVSDTRFTIEYPLNSGNLVHDSGVLSVNNSAQAQNVNTSFSKNNPVFNSDNGQDNNKCLITVYSPTNDSSWNYTISDVDVPPPNLLPPPTLPTIDDLGPLTINISAKFKTQGVESLRGARLLENLESQLQVLEDNGTLTDYESSAIANVLASNKDQLFVLNTSTILGPVSGTNIKVTVEYTQDVTNTKINLQYTRLTNSLAPGNTGAAVVDCHYYKYIGTQLSFDTAEAQKQLKSQINSDTFLNTVISQGAGQVSIGENQRSLLQTLVLKSVAPPVINYPVIRFGFQTNKVVIYDKVDKNGKEIERLFFETTIPIENSDGFIYIDTGKQIVEIVYPSICTPRNFGN
jgi:hypothetical protein